MIRIFAWLAPAVLVAMVSRILAAIGITYLTFVGLDSLMNWIMSEVQSTLSGLPETALNLMGIAKLDIVFNIFVSASNVCLLFFVAKRFRLF